MGQRSQANLKMYEPDTVEVWLKIGGIFRILVAAQSWDEQRSEKARCDRVQDASSGASIVYSYLSEIVGSTFVARRPGR
jgi:hypothetical protein